MKKLLLQAALLLLPFYGMAVAETAYPQTTLQNQPKPLRLGATLAKINASTTVFTDDKRLGSGKGITLKSGATEALNGERAEADIVFDIKLPAAGRYEMRTYAVTDDEGAALMKKAKSKYESMYIRIQIDGNRATKRVVYVPWDIQRQISGKFAFTGKEQQLKIWLPRGVRLEYAELAPYTPPAVPAAAQQYKPAVVPPATHPRLWVNRGSLPKLKAAVTAAENLPAWEKVKQAALSPFTFSFDPNAEVSFNAELEKAAEYKAFYYLVSGDKKAGLEAISLMKNYLSHVEFGNLLDITREMGRAITTGSEVFDWCYDLLTPEDKKLLTQHLLRLADDMEIGWPPFLQSVVNGHGNEAQVCRDLLSMSIALYNEDPLPYQYTSYVILENLVPMRKFEYQSPRHNQGVDYGAYRFGWDMHAAWLFYSMTGKPVFDENIKEVRKFWHYMRTPDGQMLRDGDGFTTPTPGQPFYWKSPMTMLLCYAYAADPVLKGEFQRQGGLPENPVLYLLLNDPALKADPALTSLPLTKTFGPVLGSMVARTGWAAGENSDDVVAEIKGGGYHAGNHQHSDAGAIQLYYRGFQFGDLGQYKFYGTPYDQNFTKRSIAHSMMLAVDPAEKYGRTESNDGGSRFNQSNPKSPEEATSNPQFKNGTVLSEGFGPSPAAPLFSYFSADLTSAYSAKLSAYTRSFCFLNMNRKDVPAIIILHDRMTTTDPSFKKYWQINALNEPALNDGNIILHNTLNGRTGKTHINMLIPAKSGRQLQMLHKEDANSSFAFKYEAPMPTLPEANGHRLMISPAESRATDTFLTIFQVVDGETSPLPVQSTETAAGYIVTVGDRVVFMNKNSELVNKEVMIKVPAGNYQFALTGLAPGKWRLTGAKGKPVRTLTVLAGNNTLFFEGPGGAYSVKMEQ